METTVTLQEAQELRQIITNPIVGQDSRVSVSAADTSMGFLQQKLIAGSNVSLAVENPGGVEQLRVDAAQQVPTPTGVDGRVLTEQSSVATWADAPLGLPTPTGVDGRVLVEQGSVPVWADLPSGGGADMTIAPIFNPGIQINYDTGYDGPEPGEVVFRQQSDVDAYLASKGATAFKYIMKVYDNAIPTLIQHQVKFYLQPGVHRPQNPLPAGSAAAWDFARVADGLNRKQYVRGKGYLIIYQGPTSEDYYNTWTSMLGDLPITAFNNNGTATESASVTVSGTPFGADDSLVGYWAITNNYFLPRPIIKNTANQVWTTQAGSGTPTTLRICKPSVIMRNSYDDVSRVHATMINFQHASVVPGTFQVQFDSIRFDQWGSNSVAIRGANQFIGMWGCLFDHAAQKNEFGTDGFEKAFQLQNLDYQSGSGTQTWLCSFRSVKLATVPGTQVSGPIVDIDSPESLRMVSNHSWITSLFSGFQSSPVLQKNSKVSMSGLAFTKCNGGSYLASFQNCYMDFRGSTFPSNGAINSNGGFSLTDCDMDFQFNVDVCGFDGGLGVNYYYMSLTRCRQMALSQGFRGALGPTPGQCKGFNIIGPRSAFALSKNNTLIGAGTEFKVGWYGASSFDATYTQAQILAMRTAHEQPASQLNNAVVIEEMDDNLTIGNAAQLTLTQPGNLLAFKGHGETLGANVDVSAGGRFRLVSSSGKGCNVRVVPGSLPGVTTTATFDVGYGGIFEPWGDVRIMAHNN